MSKLCTLLALWLLSVNAISNPHRERIIVGVDNKLALKESGLIKVAPSKDYVCFIVVNDALNEQSADCSLELENSIFGPPTNLALTPDNQFALVANSMRWVKGEKKYEWNASPDTALHLIAFKNQKAEVRHTLTVAEQPSGIAISRDGTLIVVAHRKGQGISLIERKNETLVLLDFLPLGSQISSVAFTPDAKRILATRFDQHHVALIDIQNKKLINPEYNIPVGLWPYNIKIDPQGRYAISANTGNSGLPDGNSDSLSLIDLTRSKPKTVQHINVGDGPEGLAISANGKLIAAPLLQGSGLPFKNTDFYTPYGGLVILKMENGKLKEIDRFKVGGFPEGVAFSEDGSKLYLGNLADNNVQIFLIEGDKVRDSGVKIELPGQPVSMGNGLP